MYHDSNTPSTSSSHTRLHESTADEFTARITSWVKTIEPAVPLLESMASRTIRKKTRKEKPYLRPAAEVLRESHGSSSTDGSPVSALPDPRQNILNLRNASRIDRSLRSLPHPKHNPLITCCPEDLQEEYARIVLLYNTIEEKKQSVEGAWLARPSTATNKELVNLEMSSQAIINAAQYIVDFAYSLRINIDFQAIFMLYRSPPKVLPIPSSRIGKRRMSLGI